MPARGREGPFFSQSGTLSLRCRAAVRSIGRLLSCCFPDSGVAAGKYCADHGTTRHHAASAGACQTRCRPALQRLRRVLRRRTVPCGRAAVAAHARGLRGLDMERRLANLPLRCGLDGQQDLAPLGGQMAAPAEPEMDSRWQRLRLQFAGQQRLKRQPCPAPKPAPSAFPPLVARLAGTSIAAFLPFYLFVSLTHFLSRSCH